MVTRTLRTQTCAIRGSRDAEIAGVHMGVSGGNVNGTCHCHGEV